MDKTVLPAALLRNKILAPLSLGGKNIV